MKQQILNILLVFSGPAIKTHCFDIHTLRRTSQQLHFVGRNSYSSLLSCRLASNKDGNNKEDNSVMVESGSEGDVFTPEQWEELRASQPTQWTVMKELLGINILTYILAGLIVLFGGLNLVLGPGWLGGNLEIQGTGSMEKVAPSLPETIDLSREEYLL